ncbi:WAS/WASL-interacting protein family member 1 [Drosophila madeirensis]|uniref:WAS/WASL-interacting protein family member 1 n=1 Tax=Drosophila madeirensis TaxID=30013 RepID=A0AAU9GCE0_DROMD
MKLFCAVLVIYVVALMLFGAEGHGSGSSSAAEQAKLRGRLFQRAGRHVRELSQESAKVANEEQPPPPKEFRSRRDVANEQPPPPPMQFRSRRAVANEEPPPPPKEFRQRRQAPPGLPPPPEGMPAPPQM